MDLFRVDSCIFVVSAPLYLDSDKFALLNRVYQFSVLQAIESAANCPKKDDEDWAEALTRLREKMVRGEDKLAKLLSILPEN